MVEKGLYDLIQSGTSNLAPGFAVTLPQNQLSASAPMAWTYRSITSKPLYTLAGQVSYTCWVVQIDCYGFQSAALSQQLYYAIDGVLRGGWQGTFTDPDNTVVNSILRKSTFVDLFKDENKSYVRSVDYEVCYYQT